jgi:hypothetical protein
MLQVVHAAAVKALSSSELQKKLVEQGGIPSPGTPEAFRELIVADSKNSRRSSATSASRWKAECKQQLLFPSTRSMMFAA